MRKIIVLCFLFVLHHMVASPTFANGFANDLHVIEVRVDRNGKGYVQFSSDLTTKYTSSRPSCSTHSAHLAFDVSTDAGKAIMSAALAAQASNKKVKAVGTNTCDIYSTVESIAHFYVRN